MQDVIKDYDIKNIIRLEQNYRSYNNILKAANLIISNNPSRIGKISGVMLVTAIKLKYLELLMTFQKQVLLLNL